ncbi:MAG: S-layer homology domain-containing protein [Bacillota bacterium]|nr:S-layer homology domain-containing protein [Bacillota bacterium]
MFRRQKKTICLIITVLFLFTLSPAIALEAVVEKEIMMKEEGSVAVPKDIKVSLEEAIKIAKEHFNVSADYDVFRSSYNENESNNTWNLNWFDSTGQIGEVNVGINSITGEVMSFNSYNPKDLEGSAQQGYLPKLTRKEAQKIAESYFVKLTDKNTSDILPQPNTYQDVTLYKGPKFYEFSYARLVNGVPYKSDRTTISVNADTGELRSFHHNWDYKATFANTRVITQDDAVKLIKENIDMELIYYKGYSRDGERPIQLVYQAKNPQNTMVDVSTGKLVEQQEYYDIYYDYAQGKMMKESMPAGNFTPQEQQELDQIAGLLSKEDAMAVATKNFDISEEYTLAQANLNRDWEFPQLIIWRFSWRFETKQKYAHMDVEIDAKTGKVIGFSQYSYDYESDSDMYVKPEDYKIKGRAAALEYAQKYIEENYPEIKDSIRLEVQPHEKLPVEDRFDSGYWFRFTRLVDDIPFPSNYISISVDAVKGEINNMSLRWIEQTFPKANDVIARDEIIEQFLTDNKVELEYVRQYDHNLGKLDNIYLVYRIPQIKSNLIDAGTGANLNHNGDVITERETVQYTDISGHWAEEDIKLLSEYKLLDFDGNEFKPNQAITQGELIKIFTRLQNPWLDEPRIDPIYQMAVRNGIIMQAEKAPDSTVAREDMALMLVRFLGYEEISKLDIFKLDFADVAEISKDKLGAVAIVDGFGFITGDDAGNFMPAKETTRAEAATILARMLRQ